MLIFPPEIQAAVDAVKAEMGVTTAPAAAIAERLDPEMRSRFWESAVDQYFERRLAELALLPEDIT